MQYGKGHRCQIPGLADIYMETFGYKTDGYFAEVGAFDCYTWSNTWPLASIGWRGLYYEPQPELADRCRERCMGMDNVSVCQLALGNTPGKETFYLGGSLSTLDKMTRDKYMRIPWARSTGHGENETIVVDVSTLDIELRKHEWPVGFDVLVVDVEGSELDVLNGFSLRKWQPLLCIIETHDKLGDPGLSMKAPLIDAYFEFSGYDKIYTDTINSIYRKEVSRDNRS